MNINEFELANDGNDFDKSKEEIWIDYFIEDTENMSNMIYSLGAKVICKHFTEEERQTIAMCAKMLVRDASYLINRIDNHGKGGNEGWLRMYQSLPRK